MKNFFINIPEGSSNRETTNLIFTMNVKNLFNDLFSPLPYIVQTAKYKSDIIHKLYYNIS